MILLYSIILLFLSFNQYNLDPIGIANVFFNSCSKAPVYQFELSQYSKLSDSLSVAKSKLIKRVGQCLNDHAEEFSEVLASLKDPSAQPLTIKIKPFALKPCELPKCTQKPVIDESDMSKTKDDSVHTAKNTKPVISREVSSSKLSESNSLNTEYNDKSNIPDNPTPPSILGPPFTDLSKEDVAKTESISVSKILLEDKTVDFERKGDEKTDHLQPVKTIPSIYRPNKNTSLFEKDEETIKENSQSEEPEKTSLPKALGAASAVLLAAAGAAALIKGFTYLRRPANPIEPKSGATELYDPASVSDDFKRDVINTVDMEMFT